MIAYFVQVVDDPGPCYFGPGELNATRIGRVLRTVAEAREEGDLKENAAYIQRHQQKGHIIGRTGQLKGQLNRADIVDCTTANCDRAVFGTVVTL